MSQKIKIGISGCLLGQKVRFDGQHKYHWYINNVLNEYFEYHSVCPEVSIGMGTPRKTVRLVGDVETPRMIEPHHGTDWTEKMNTFSSKTAPSFADLSGFIFKKGSPSCGAFRTKVYQDNGIPLNSGQGLFSKAVTQKWPLMPYEEEGRLNDSLLRENFIERVFGYYRLQELTKQRFKRGLWVNFHQNHKYLLLSHSRKNYNALGQLVASIAQYTPKEFQNHYSQLYMETLAIKTTRKKHMDVMIHILGFLKKLLSSKQKQHILSTVESYKLGQLPLIVPVTLLKHYIEVFEVEYINNQIYLNPHPHELGLRNHM